MSIELINGDCLEVMRGMADCSVDAIVSDPPAGIAFMGKHWDKDKGGRNEWVAWMESVATECKRVLKPGGHALIWSIPRTSHWTAWAWESAGFECRDKIVHIFGSGFPKSLNIEKATNNSGLDGMGTALKPAHEDWLLFRKPIEKGLTIAENCLKWGTGGLSIDDCRVLTDDDTGRALCEPTGWKNTSKQVGSINDDWKKGRFPANLIHSGEPCVLELFPETKSGARKAGQGGNGNNGTIAFRNKSNKNDFLADKGSSARFFYCPKPSPRERNAGLEGLEVKRQGLCGENNNPVHKNHHPTVKSIALMEYLVKLITRDGQTVLDPFMGSGTTGLAAKNLNRNFIGIEMDKGYFEIARERIENGI